ncbi:MAG: hypothetical protein ABJN69_17710 [Hellea sp.]
MMRLILISILTWAVALTATAQIVVDSQRAEQTSLTIYPDDLAMVTEVRKVTLPEGPATIRFLGVSDQIIPQSAILQEFEGLNLERNFDTDVITQGSLMEKAVGETITIRRVNPATGDIRDVKAKLLSAPLRQVSAQSRRWARNELIQGAVFEVNGRVEALECSGLAEAVLYSQLPEGLNPSPVLSLRVESEAGGETEVTISYLTRGLGWEADYRMDMAPNATEGSLMGWLTLTNDTSKSFENVPTAIIAGTLNRANDDYRPALPRIFTPNCWAKGSTKKGVQNVELNSSGGDRYEAIPAFAPPPPVMMMDVGYANDEIIVTASKRQATREDLGDYKLYRTPQPVTVAPMQTKQIAFLSIPDVEADRVFAFNFPENKEAGPFGATVEYRVDNSKEGNLAQPLPKGNFRVFTHRANGAPAYLGEDRVDNLAVDLPADIEVSESIAVQMQSRIEGISRGKGDDAVHKVRFTADIYNATAEAVETEVEIRDIFLRAGDITETSHDPKPDEIVPTYPITLAPESAERFELTVPMQEVYYFDYSDLDFDDEDYLGEKQTSYAAGRYGLSSSLGSGGWATRYFNQVTGLLLKIDTTLLSYSESETDEGDEEITAKLKHVVKNTTDKTVKMAFVLPDDYGPIEILSSSIETDAANFNTWLLELKPGKSKTLTYEILLQD